MKTNPFNYAAHSAVILAVVGMFALTPNALFGEGPKKISHSGWELQIPENWINNKLPQEMKFDGIMISRQGGYVGVKIEKLPGDLEKQLLLLKDREDSQSDYFEEKIVSFGLLKGEGTRIVETTRGRSGKFIESIVFYPDDGERKWYIFMSAEISDHDALPLRECYAILSSLRWIDTPQR